MGNDTTIKDDETLIEDKVSTSLASLDILNDAKLLKVALKSKSAGDLEKNMTKLKKQFEDYSSINWDSIDWKSIYNELREEVVDDTDVIDESEDTEEVVEDTEEVSENANVVGGGMSPTSSNTVEDTEEVVEDTEEVVEDTEEVVEDTEEIFKLTSSDIDISEDTDAILSGHDFTDEYKEKVKSIYESAVLTKINEHLEILEEKYKEKYEKQLNESVELIHTELLEDVDKFLSYAVDEWISENKIAIESGIKSSILENFISGLKNVFEENYIDIPENKLDIYEVSKESEQKLQEDLNFQINKNIELTEKLVKVQRDTIITELTEGLTLTQMEKVKKLSEHLEFNSEEVFKGKVKIFVESYFSSESEVTESRILDENASDTAIEDSPMVKEELEVTGSNDLMSYYASTLSRCKK
jgi:hypothetical protein